MHLVPEIALKTAKRKGGKRPDQQVRFQIYRKIFHFFNNKKEELTVRKTSERMNPPDVQHKFTKLPDGNFSQNQNSPTFFLANSLKTKRKTIQHSSAMNHQLVKTISIDKTQWTKE